MYERTIKAPPLHSHVYTSFQNAYTSHVLLIEFLRYQ